MFEVVIVDHAVREARAQGLSEAEVRQVMRSDGAPSATADSLLKIRDGITSVDEVSQMLWL